MDCTIPVLAVDFRPTSRRDDSCFTLRRHACFVYPDGNCNLFPTYRLPVGRKIRFENVDSRIPQCQENKTKTRVSLFRSQLKCSRFN